MIAVGTVVSGVSVRTGAQPRSHDATSSQHVQSGERSCEVLDAYDDVCHRSFALS
jgi:hypothetical protein